jgi:hypothetical protein
MQNSEPLVYLGIAILVVSALNILVPYLRGRSDVITAWNILWLGGALFTGVGSLAVTYGNFHWPELQWFQPTASDVNRYIVGSIVFYGTLLICYYTFKWPRRLTSHFFRKWPALSTPTTLTFLCVFGLVAISASVTQGVFFIGPLLFNVAHKAIIFATVFSFCYWYQDRRQLLKLALFLFVFLFAAFDAILLFHGRRLLMSAAAAPLICFYWLHCRYWPPRKNLFFIALAAFLMVAVAAFYSTFRHFRGDYGGEEQRTIATVIKNMQKASADNAVSAVTSDAFNYFSQYCTHYSLLTIQLLDSGQIEVQPLNTLAFLAAYPIPRAIFPEKPSALGLRMVRDVLRLPYGTNWGLGIVAYGYCEGGLWVIVLYAVLIVLGVRLLDDALVAQPNNPFLLGILSATAPHFAALIRGDPTNMSAEIVEAYVFAWAIGLLTRFFVSTAPSNYYVANPSGYLPRVRA